MQQFIDISKHQGDINISAVVKNNDLKMIMMKSSEGVGYQDPKVSSYLNQVRNIGVKAGFYHFVKWDNSANNAVNEAQSFINIIKKLGVEDMDTLALDFEVKTSYRSAYNLCKEFLNIVQDAFPKNKVWLYANRSTIQSNNLDSLGYGIWCADYGVNDGIMHTRPNVDNLEAWQYSSVARLSGYGGDLDINVSYIDLGSIAENDELTNNKGERIMNGKMYVVTAGKKLASDTLLGISTKGRTMVFTVNEGEKYDAFGLDNGNFLLVANDDVKDDMTGRVVHSIVELQKNDFDYPDELSDDYVDLDLGE